jgi:hypothetical protein
LLVNLIAAHASRFTWSWRKAPLFTIHGGLVVLLLSELITGLFARETEMTLDEGAVRSYSEAPRHAELVIVDSSSPERDRVWAIAQKWLGSGDFIEHDTLPFRVKVHRYYQNSRVFLPTICRNKPLGESRHRREAALDGAVARRHDRRAQYRQRWSS